MFAVLAEGSSDLFMLEVIVKRLLKPGTRVMKRAFGGCGKLIESAGRTIEDFARDGSTHFIICHDSDGEDSVIIRRRVQDGLKGKISADRICFIAVPIQEIEAWIIADEGAIKRTIPSFTSKPTENPENITSPKEVLIRQSRGRSSKPLYDPATHNQKVAVHLDLDKVAQKCPSFSELKKFILKSAVA